jgi:5-formyltetrahydrofolate cyclo-ligase
MMIALSAEKAKLRRAMKDHRAAIPEAERTRRSYEAAGRLVSLPEVDGAAVAFVFRSFGTEISTEPVIQGLAERGLALALPILVDGDLQAAAYRLGDPLTASPYGALEPLARTIVEAERVDLVVTPGLAFDDRGYRLGFGGAYYDRFLPRTRPDASRVGFCFDEQVVDAVPHGDGDVPVQTVVTDRRVLRATA